MTTPKTGTKNAKITAAQPHERTPEPPELLAPAEVRALRESLGVSRSALSELTGLSGSRVWAAEQDNKEVSDAHRTAIAAALRDVEKNGLPAHLRKPEKQQKPERAPSLAKVELALRLAQVQDLLKEAASAKTLKEVRVLLEEMERATTGNLPNGQTGEPTGDEAAVTPAPSHDTDSATGDQTAYQPATDAVATA